VILVGLLFISANAGLFGDIKKIGQSIGRDANQYIVKPVANVEKEVANKIKEEAKKVGKEISKEAKAVAHETTALYDHLSNLKTTEEKEEIENLIKEQ
jgi:hypothetical protein